MQVFSHPLYQQEIEKCAKLPLRWEQLRGCKILITGACGMIGSYMVDLLMAANRLHCLDLCVLAMGRNEEKARTRFAAYADSENFRIVCGDVNRGVPSGTPSADYIFHAASNTHPVAYATDPIGTLTTNVLGTYNLLQFAADNGCKRFIFASTVEIYGENRGDREYFTEDYCGYIDCNTLRAGYPESKRAGEALCQAFIAQKKLDVVIPRLPRAFGPTLLSSDTKALSQFLRKALQGEDIVLKSDGSQYYSFIYVADAVLGVLHCLFHGESGAAYNISDRECDITLRELAEMIAGMVGRKVVFDLPDKTEQAGFSKATKAVMDSSKLKALGWVPFFSLKEGIANCLSVMRAAE
ncbi:MAG: NAD-dependent epimerase/dehydratase family protein [Akkermansia sp.]|nr:NAD-dependent epimerase/dehydratase family protein [Akkermansia sp.]